MYGVTDTGFVQKPYSVIREELAAAIVGVSPSINLTDESPFGQILGIFASALAEQWEVEAEGYAARSILTANGEALDRLVFLTEVRRNAASQSTVTATVNLSAGATLPNPAQAHPVDSPDDVFEALTFPSNSGGSAANFDVVFQSVNTGPVRANSGTLTEILTPSAGWNSITNAEDASLGGNVETDAKLRPRYFREAGGNGLTTEGAIAKAVRAVANVSECIVFENPLNVTVGTMPPNSIEAVVRDGGLADAGEIAQAIWNTKGMGIATAGSLSAGAINQLGEGKIINFSRVTSVDVDVAYILRTSTKSLSWITAFQQTIADWGDANLGTGQDVLISDLYCPAVSYPGVLEVLGVQVRRNGDPTYQVTSLSIENREIADLDSSRVLVII